MKKMYKSLMLVAAAAMAFVGCSKEEISDNAQPESGVKVTRSFTAEIASTRTTFNDDATKLKWTAGDKLGIFTDIKDVEQVASSAYAEGDTNFTAQIDTKATTVYAYYPYFYMQNVGETPRTYENASLYIDDAQTQTEAGVLNGSMVGMYASASLVEGQNTKLIFTPIASLIVFNIYDKGANGGTVKSIKFEPAGDEKLNGQTIYNLGTGVTASTGSKTSATVTLTTPYAAPKDKLTDMSGYIYLAVTPKVYSGGGTFVVTMSNNDTYTFTTTNPIDVSNVYAPFVIPMNLAKGQFTPAKDYSGEYLIVGEKESEYYACKKYVSGNNCKALKITKLADGRFEGVGIEDCKMIVTGGMSGDKNLYSIQDAGGKYLYVAGTASSHNYMKGTAKPADQNPESRAWWKISLAGDVWSIIGAYEGARNIMRFNSGSTLFSCYGSGQSPVSLIPWSQVKLDLTTSIVADDITGVPAAGVTDQTFTFDVNNDNGYTATAACDGTVVTSATVNNETKTVTYSVSENTDTAAGRTGTITITLNDDAATSLTINVSQSKFLPTSIVAEDIIVPAVGVTDATFTYSITDGNGYDYIPEVSFDGCVTAASVDAATKTVTYSVDANTTAEKRNGTIKITLNDPVKTYKIINVEQAEAGSATWVVDYTFVAKNIGNGYGLHTGVAANNGVAWTVTFGQGTYIGTNKDNKSKCKLGANYVKVGAPMGYTADRTQVAAIIGEGAMANIGKVVVSGDTDSHNPDNISLVYSVDGETYTLVETQAYNQTAGNTWEFEAVPSAYYAVVMEYSGAGYMRTNNLKIEYSSKK